jgi:putative DNA primase/helicase
VGIVCGEIELLDIDTKNDPGRDITGKFLTALAEQRPDLCGRIFHEVTPGGYHLWYRVEEMGHNKKLCSVRYTDDEKLSRNSATGWATVIETRGYGGYGVCFPTPGYKLVTQIKGIAITASPPHESPLPRITSEEKCFLYDLARSFSDQRDQDTQAANIPAGGQKGDRPGDKYNAEASQQTTVSLMVSAGWDVIRTKAGICEIGRPGRKHRNKHDASVDSRGTLWVFSTNTEFEPERAYDPFSVLAALRHGSDRSAAAKSLIQATAPVSQPSPGPSAQADRFDDDDERLWHTPN